MNPYKEMTTTMTTENNTASRFGTFKDEILRRARAAHACREQYGRAYASTSMAALMAVIRDNFSWACRNKVLTPDIIAQYHDDFADHGIRCNENVTGGFLLAYGSATVEAYGNATVEAYGNATVKAYGNATVKAWGNATVEAYDSATVKAYDSATVEAWGNATVKAYGNATVKAWGNATVEAYGNATVKACGSAYVSSYYVIECKLSDNAIHRVVSLGEIRHASDNLKFVRI